MKENGSFVLLLEHNFAHKVTFVTHNLHCLKMHYFNFLAQNPAETSIFETEMHHKLIVARHFKLIHSNLSK